jgi:hypothetical protein
MFVGLEHVAIASPNPPSPAQCYVDPLGFSIILVRDMRFLAAPYGAHLNRMFFQDGEGNSGHLIQRKEPLP